MKQTDKEIKCTRYILINYFDVWGNAKDGFEINNQCQECDDMYISDDSTDKEICTFLKQSHFLATDDMRKLQVIDDGTMIEIQTKAGMPLFCLMPYQA